MSEIVYMIRTPLQTSPNTPFTLDRSALVLSLEDPRCPGKVVHSPPAIGFTAGETVSYDQILKIVLEGKKVITL